MANDRVYVQCKKCRATRMLFKFWGGGEVGDILPIPNRTPISWGTSPLVSAETLASAYDDTERLEDFSAWTQKHLRECAEAWGDDLGGDPAFVLVAESGDPSIPVPGTLDAGTQPPSSTAVRAERAAIGAFVDQEGDPILAEMIRKGVHHSGQPSTAETETSVKADAYIAARQRHLGPYEQVTVGTGGFCYPCDRCRKTWLGFADSDSAEVFALDHGATCAGQK